jgi:N-acetyl-alpha-D-muramate 1-phosphate uridylyltransferase
MKAFLLAAGKGKRLLPLTETTPKPLIAVAGEPLIVRHIEQLKLAGVTEFVINTHWLADRLQDFLGDGSKFGIQIQWSHEDELLETGGGIQKALHLIGEQPFLLVSADIWTDFEYKKLLANPLSEEEVARLVLVDNPEHHARGDFVLETDTESPQCGLVRMPLDQGLSTLTYSGIALIRPDWVESWKFGQSAFPLREPLFAAITGDQISGYHYSGRWTDIGSLERLQAIRDELEVEYAAK